MPTNGGGNVSTRRSARRSTSSSGSRRRGWPRPIGCSPGRRARRAATAMPSRPMCAGDRARSPRRRRPAGGARRRRTPAPRRSGRPTSTTRSRACEAGLEATAGDRQSEEPPRGARRAVRMQGAFDHARTSSGRPGRCSRSRARHGRGPRRDRGVANRDARRSHRGRQARAAALVRHARRARREVHALDRRGPARANTPRARRPARGVGADECAEPRARGRRRRHVAGAVALRAGGSSPVGAARRGRGAGPRGSRPAADRLHGAPGRRAPRPRRGARRAQLLVAATRHATRTRPPVPWPRARAASS